MRRTVVLTSRENFVWASMQEIIPSIERLWLDSEEPGRHEVRCFDVDGSALRDYLPALLQADQIVMTCFTLKLCRALALLRKDLGIRARLVIYLHNQATIACWPLRVWGLGDCLRTDDVFVSSCRYDAEALARTFENARSLVIPFSLPELELPSIAPAKARPIPLVYVGRISPQKNLHLLLCSLSRLVGRTEPFELHIYGQEDDLGSPNMGIELRNYQGYLENLAEKLGISEHVRFHGYRERESLFQELAKISSIFISPSLHSDENFGMAAFRSLCLGHLAVLSRWGGHADFESPFRGQIFFTEVHESEMGPYIEAHELSRKIAEAIRAYRDLAARSPRLPETYQPARIRSALLDLALEECPEGEALRFTELADRILINRSRYLPDSERQCKIFSSYADSASTPFFRAYGMRSSSAPELLPRAIRLMPWASIQDGAIEIQDPHRGDHRLAIEEGQEKVELVDWRGVRRVAGAGFARNILTSGLGEHDHPH